ncbi:hypothetical protein [Campylobacter sp. RM12651]|uniref:hypothetical protein n=1 Tax=Campylobacter sp. RM12651 TaxID=1660079 RepID=UPI001EFBF39A|nr:hypothetical protein [Campylobacter sp. RM12651]ULO03780.1 hypothetical protein AVBRAN_1326 [Campylobacter sp. RM12651]
MKLNEFLNTISKEIAKELNGKQYNTLSLEAQIFLEEYRKENFDAYDFQKNNNMLLKHILLREDIKYNELLAIYDDENLLNAISDLDKNTNVELDLFKKIVA